MHELFMMIKIFLYPIHPLLLLYNQII
jgi:hypothetical protein